MLNVIYTIKTCMLIMYTRLTMTLPHRRLVLYLSVYVACGWFATQITFFTTCRPFKGYWAMPPPNPQCTTLQNYAIVQACFNISSDLLMICIPIPMIIKLRLPWKQKGVLVAIFGLGLFVVIAAVLTKVFNLSNIWDPSYMLWYTRESSVAIYVSNLPCIWPLMRELFPALRALTPGQKDSTSKKGSNYFRGRPGSAMRLRMNQAFGTKSENGVVTIIKGKGESMEEFNGEDLEVETRQDGWDSNTRTWGSSGSGCITKSTTIRISEECVGENDEIQLVQIPEREFIKERDLEKRSGHWVACGM